MPVRERMLVDLVTSSGRASTGNPGLDDILGGGLTPDRLYLVEGTPGTGKTTLALQFLMEGVRLGVPALYITLSEQPMSCAPSPNLTVGLSTAYRCSSARVPLAALRLAIAGLSLARRLAGGLSLGRRFLPLFRPGALPIQLARGFFSHSLCRSPPSARPLERTVDQHRQQKHRTDDLHDGE